MAEYKDVYEGIAKILECGICMNHLNKPRILQCQHSFCKDCIDNILTFNADGSAEAKCPFRCETLTAIPPEQTSAQLPSNYQLLGIIDMYKGSSKNEKVDFKKSSCYSCCSCDESTVSLYCSECDNFYCSKCEHAHVSHASLIKLSFHEGYEQYMPTCKQHDALGSLICCKEIICVYCRYRSHNGHQVEQLTTHANHIRQLFFNPDGSGGKIDKIMTNAEANLENTTATFAQIKQSLIDTLRDRMLDSLADHVEKLEKEALRVVQSLDERICQHMQMYPNVTPSEFLKTVSAKEDVELVLRKDIILKEYAKYTTRVPTLSVGITETNSTRVQTVTSSGGGSNGSADKTSSLPGGVMAPAMPSTVLAPLGIMTYEYGEYNSIGNNEETNVTVKNFIPENNEVVDGHGLVVKIQSLIKEMNLKEGRYSTTIPRFTEVKKLIPSPIQEAISMLDMREYDYIEELCAGKKEQLLIDMIDQRKDIALLKDSTGVTLLHSAAQHGLDTLLFYLLKAKLLDINVTQKFKQTPLHYAAYHNKVSCVKLLLENNADRNLKNHRGNTPVQVARQYKSNDVLPLLE